MEVIILGFCVVICFVQFGLAVAVYTDAKRIDSGRLTMKIGPALWACATLLGEVVAVGVYWIIYHSSLRPEQTEP